MPSKPTSKTTRKTTREDPKPNARVVELTFSVAVPLNNSDRQVKDAIEDALNEVSNDHHSWAVGFTKVTASHKDFVEDLS